MEITIGKHRLGYDGAGYTISRIVKHRTTGEETQTAHAYFASLEGAAKALLERMMGDNLRADRGNVESLRDLIVAVADARDEVCEAVKGGGLAQ